MCYFLRAEVSEFLLLALKLKRAVRSPIPSCSQHSEEDPTVWGVLQV
jgi:hypothetical protein